MSSNRPITADPEDTPSGDVDPAEVNPVADDPDDAPENQPAAAPTE